MLRSKQRLVRGVVFWLTLLMSGSALADEVEGTVMLDAQAGSHVYVDSQYIGVLPMPITVKEGEHTFRIESPHGLVNEFKTTVQFDGQTDIEIVPPDITTIPVNLFGQRGGLVHVDGDRVGTIPVSVILTPGDHLFEVELPNGTRFKRTLAISGDRDFMNLPLNPP